MEEKITNYLKEKYDSVGIVLYGSRAEGTAHPKSDWDIFVFTDKKEEEIEDFADINGFEGEPLDVTPLPVSTLKDSNFIFSTAMHPVKSMKVLHDDSGGLLEKIIHATQDAYSAGPDTLTVRKKDIYRKILNNFIRKIELRPNDHGYVLFGFGFFYMHAVRYWFEVRGEWPLNIHEAGMYIQEKDPSFYKLLEIVHLPSSAYEAKLQAVKEVKGELFDLDKRL